MRSFTLDSWTPVALLVLLPDAAEAVSLVQTDA
jgi:hypothetical protein